MAEECPEILTFLKNRDILLILQPDNVLKTKAFSEIGIF